MVILGCTLFTLFVLAVGAERGPRVKRIVGGVPADVPPEDDPTVYTNFGGRSALVRGVREFPHYAFRGIRYAHPPTGKDRFLVSQKLLISCFLTTSLIYFIFMLSLIFNYHLGFYF